MDELQLHDLQNMEAAQCNPRSISLEHHPESALRLACCRREAESQPCQT